MQQGKKTTFPGVLVLILLVVFLGAYVTFLVSKHYVKGYSDPTHWIAMSENLLYEGEVARWSTVFAMYLIVPLVLLGNHYVYLSNIFWLVAIVCTTTTLVALTCRDVKERPLWLLGLLASVCLVFLHGTPVIELVNPLREPFSFTMLLLTFIFLMIFHDTEKAVWVIFSGICFGIAIGAREPLFYSIIPIFYLYVFFCWNKLSHALIMAPVYFLAGLVAGIVPFFLHNHLYSGVWWLPSFLVSNVQKYLSAEAFGNLWWVGSVVALLVLVGLAVALYMPLRRMMVSDDQPPLKDERNYRKTLLWLAAGLTVTLVALGLVVHRLELIPDMRWGKFPRIFVKTIRYLFKYNASWLTVLLCFSGVVYAFRKRYFPFLIIFIPSTLLYLWFWSYSGWVMVRYVFLTQLFLYPVIAVGLWGVLSFVEGHVHRRFPRFSFSGACVFVVVLLFSMKLGSALFSISSRPKVWHLGLLKQQMEQTLEKPYVFYSDRNHYSEIFATISGERFTSVFIKANDLFQFRNSALEKGGLNGALLSVRADALEVLRERHIYSYPNQTQIEPLILRWFDYVPVLDASTLYPPVRVYGNVLDQQIYEILPWSKKEIRTEVPVPGPGVYLLGINLHGLSDYLDRTYCRLYIDGRLAENHLTDNYQYVQFHVEEPAVKTVPVRIESDSFVSSRPAAVAVALNETIDLEFGREPLKWMNFISSELKGYKFATEHGAVLCTKGEITIPSFASAERNVYARLSYRNADPEKVFPKASYRLSSLWEGEGKSIDLEPKEKSSFFVNLGKGRNGYHETSLKLSLEKAGNQINGSDETCYIIPEMRVWTLPITLDGPASYQADINNEPVFREGFYPPERSEDGYVQWSAPEAAVYLPKAAAGMSEMAVIVEAREFRPSSHRHRPSFLFNGEAIEAIVEKGPRNEVKYVLTGLNWEKNNENRLAISVKAFNPVTEIGSNDTRALGIAVSAIVVGRR